MSIKLKDWKFATKNRCEQIPGDCIPPSACARHPTTDRSFCCDTGEDAGCWNWGNAGGDEEVTKACSVDENMKGWRCMRGSEECGRQVTNICGLQGEGVENPLSEVGSSVLDDLYSSLSVSAPSESYLSFDPFALIAATQTSSSMAASTESTTADAASATALATNTAEPDRGLSGGAIGGIVAGVVVGVALLGLGAWFLLKKKRQEKVPKVDNPGETKSDADRQMQDRQMVELGSRELRELP